MHKVSRNLFSRFPLTRQNRRKWTPRESNPLYGIWWLKTCHSKFSAIMFTVYLSEICGGNLKIYIVRLQSVKFQMKSSLKTKRPIKIKDGVRWQHCLSKKYQWWIFYKGPSIHHFFQVGYYLSSFRGKPADTNHIYILWYPYCSTKGSWPRSKYGFFVKILPYLIQTKFGYNLPISFRVENFWK